MMPLALILAAPLLAAGSPGDRFVHLDERSPFHPHRDFPRLTTPMWFGEEGVEAAVILSIDDMRETGKYLAYLEPILARLREVEGRSPLSIFSNTVDPRDPQLARWLEEGVRFDVHTRSHPCPLLRGTFAQAAAEVLDCLENLNRIPGARPAAFRMPCCDSINSASPRFFWEILPLRAGDGSFLQADSSVAMFVEDSHRQYAPFRNYAATADGYPYPYVVSRFLWEFPIIVPTDWQAQNRRGPNQPATVEDLKRVLDLVVERKGLYTLCFHPHGWIRNSQVVELIDHARARHGRRVRFVNFHDVLSRMERHLLGGTPLRAADGSDGGVRLLDLNGDRFMDVVIGNDGKRETRIWDPAASRFRVFPFPFPIVSRSEGGAVRETGVRFGALGEDGAMALISSETQRGMALFQGKEWIPAPFREAGPSGEAIEPSILTAVEGRDRGVRLRDLDGDGHSDLILNNDVQNAAFRYDAARASFQLLPYALPSRESIVDAEGRDRGLRFIDADGDGQDDVILSNEDEYYLYLFHGDRGWTRRALHGPAGVPGALPRIASQGQDRGAWFKDGVMYAANEETAGKPDLVEVRRLKQIVEHMASPVPSPDESLRQIQVPPGFEVELVASEPQVMDPVSLEFGPDGWMWVAEMGGYPRGEGKDAGGRIRALRDRDGDGRVDESILFAEGLSFPTGALPFGRGALVTCAPDILYLEDRDGDRRADLKRAVFTGFGQGNQQHRVNGLHRAIDNWIHGANGDSGGAIAIAARPDLPPVQIGGRDFRFRPDLAVFEAESGRTQFGLAFDDLGNRFGASNARHLMHPVIPERYLRRNPHHAPPDPVADIPDHGAMARVFPISSPLLSLNPIHVPGHFSSACGVAIYRREAFPPEYRGNAFVCEPVGNLVHQDRLVPEGATFRAVRAEEGSEFLASRDHWFRPVNLSSAPDGALYVVDMCRYVIEHPEYIPEELQGLLDFTAGRDRGRIWRVRHRAAPRPDSIHPDLARESSGRLVELLGHPGGWWRDTAQGLLLERKDPAAEGALREILASSQAPLARLHALWTLEGLGRLDDALLERAMDDPHPGVREHALRIAGDRLRESPRLLERALALAGDREGRVRFQAALSLGESPGEAAGAALGAILVRDFPDRWTRAAVLSSSLHHAGRLLVDLLAARDLPWEARRPEVQSLTRVLVKRGRARELEAVLEKAPSRDAPERWQFLVLEALGEGAPGSSLPVPSRWIESVRGRALEVARSSSGAVGERVEAIRALGGSLLDDPSLLDRLLGPREAVEAQLAAVKAITGAASRREAASSRLIEAWASLGPSVRAEVLEGILRGREGARALLAAVREGKVRPEEIAGPARERIERSADPAIRERAAELFRRKLPEDRERVLARYRGALAGLRGDAARGKAVFRERCASCHRLEGEGVDVGPPIAGWGAKDDAALIEAILSPSGAVEPRYVQYLVETRNGGISSGLISNESATAITLLRANGVSETVLREDVRRLSAMGESMMPAELERAIDPQQMADLLAHLRRS